MNSGLHLFRAPFTLVSEPRGSEPIAATSFPLKRRVLGFGVVAFSALAVALGLLIDPPPPYLAGLWGLGITFMLLALVGFGVAISVDTKEGLVRCRMISGETWFSQAPLLVKLYACGVALFATLLFVYSVCFVAEEVVQDGEYWWIEASRFAWASSLFFLCVSAYAWLDAFRLIRMGLGVSLSPIRVRLILKRKEVNLSWNQILHVSAHAALTSPGKKSNQVNPGVRIECDQFRLFDVKAFDLGSDPNVVAALIQFYLDHPQYREYLTDPEQAIRVFSEAQSD